MKEPEFILDERWIEQEKELNEILDEIKNPELEKQIYILETFVRAAALSFISKETKLKRRLFPLSKTQEIPTYLGGSEIMKPQYTTELMNVPAGVEIEPVPIPSTEQQEQPRLEYKEIPKYTKKLIKKPIIERRKPLKKFDHTIHTTTKDLITDKITNKVLATANISDRYIVNEPGLDSTDINVLTKLKKKARIKNMEKGWKLIQKYGKKYNIQQGHDTLIKYYLVNDFFGLGRIEPLLQDKDIKSISSEGPGKNVKVEINEKTLDTNIKFLNNYELLNFVQGVANRLKLKLDKKHTTTTGTFRDFQFTLSIGEDQNTPSFVAVKK